jgi:uncharacterized protein DUF5994
MVMVTIAERHVASSPSPPSRPRLRLQPDLSARAPLDGGWWPRPGDPVAELPGLILAIEGRRGPVTKVMAWAAMEQGAQAGNRTGTSALLATTTAPIPARPPASTPAGAAPDNIQLTTWDWEGRHDKCHIAGSRHVRD